MGMDIDMDAPPASPHPPRHGLRQASTLLFVPGDRPERFAKALSAGAAGVIIDLEDAVGPQHKDHARQVVIEWLGTPTPPPEGPAPLRGVRINALSTPEGLADLMALRMGLSRSNAGLDFVMLPKVESAAEVRLYAAHLCAGDRPVELGCAIESVRGLLACHEIASACPQVAMLGFGGGDLSTQLGATLAWDSLLHARSQVLQAARGAGVTALDMPFIDLENDPGLALEAQAVRALGYRSKLAIHPRQVPTLNRVMRPSAAELDKARRLVAAFESNGGNALQLDGALVDLANYRAARALLDAAPLSFS